MKFPCQIKSLGGSKYVIINSFVVEKLNLNDGDAVTIEIKKGVE
jgi:antitoxin component of MazEF toxin-antitoxin module